MGSSGISFTVLSFRLGEREAGVFGGSSCVYFGRCNGSDDDVNDKGEGHGSEASSSKSSSSSKHSAIR